MNTIFKTFFFDVCGHTLSIGDLTIITMKYKLVVSIIAVGMNETISEFKKCENGNQILLAATIPGTDIVAQIDDSLVKKLPSIPKKTFACMSFIRI